MHFDTLTVHAGSEPREGTRDVAPPIHLATTFEHGPAGERPGGHIYIRESNPNGTRLSGALAAIEGGKEALVFASRPRSSTVRPESAPAGTSTSGRATRTGRACRGRSPRSRGARRRSSSPRDHVRARSGRRAPRRAHLHPGEQPERDAPVGGARRDRGGQGGARLRLGPTFEHGPAGERPGGHIYIRESNPNGTRLSGALAAIEGGKEALVFASGPRSSTVRPESAPAGTSTSGRATRTGRACRGRSPRSRGARRRSSSPRAHVRARSGRRAPRRAHLHPGEQPERDAPVGGARRDRGGQGGARLRLG